MNEANEILRVYALSNCAIKPEMTISSPKSTHLLFVQSTFLHDFEPEEYLLVCFPVDKQGTRIKTSNNAIVYGTIEMTYNPGAIQERQSIKVVYETAEELRNAWKK